jgi:hypothetical protein
MRTHIKVLGVLHIVFGAIGVLIGLMLLMMFGGISALVGANAPEEAHVAIPVLGMIGGFVFLVLLVLSIPGIILGFGLLNFKSWSRPFGIVISALELIHVPFGTVLGIYGLFVLLQAETVAILEGRAAVPAVPPVTPPPSQPRQW